MDVASLNGSNSQTTTSGSSQVNSKEFMRLLTTQLQNQNPFEPITDAEFIGQMAQFTGLEENQKQTKALEDLAAAMSANASLQGLAQAASLIGKEVTYAGSTGAELKADIVGVKFLRGAINLITKDQGTVPLGNVISIGGVSKEASNEDTGATA
ncbi:MAG: hypothetical protein H6807_16935 [Planctomycetes bacterium]|nr:hypothetical protein [Planctomycetota bacterium]